MRKKIIRKKKEQATNKYTLEEKLIILNRIFFNAGIFKLYLNEYKLTNTLVDDKRKKIDTYFELEYKRYSVDIRRESNKNLELFYEYFYKN